MDVRLQCPQCTSGLGSGCHGVLIVHLRIWLRHRDDLLLHVSQIAVALVVLYSRPCVADVDGSVLTLR